MKKNKNSSIDVCFLIASSSKKSYQKLSESYAAIEPPTWALLLAQSCRSINFKVDIIDANAENLSNDQVLNKINELNPKIVCLVVYGQNVNAGTANMSGAIDITNFLKTNKILCPVAFIGSHVQALPVATLKKEKNIEELDTIHNIVNNAYSTINSLNSSISSQISANLSSISGVVNYHDIDKSKNIISTDSTVDINLKISYQL